MTRGDDVYLFGRAGYRPGGSCGPRVQTHFQLVVLLSGMALIRADRERFELHPGEGVLLRPGARESFAFSRETETVHTWCQILASELAPADRRALSRAGGVRIVSGSVHVLIEEGLAAPASPDANDAEWGRGV